MPPKKEAADIHQSVEELLEICRKHKAELENIDQHLGSRLRA